MDIQFTGPVLSQEAPIENPRCQGLPTTWIWSSGIWVITCRLWCWCLQTWVQGNNTHLGGNCRIRQRLSFKSHPSNEERFHILKVFHDEAKNVNIKNTHDDLLCYSLKKNSRGIFMLINVILKRIHKTAIYKITYSLHRQAPTDGCENMLNVCIIK